MGLQGLWTAGPSRAATPGVRRVKRKGSAVFVDQMIRLSVKFDKIRMFESCMGKKI